MPIQLTGLDKVDKNLSRLSNELDGTRGRDLESAMKRSLYRLVGEMAQYPPLASSSYRRTGTLGRSWTSRIKIRSVSGGIEGRIGTNVEYAPLVQSSRLQARVHRRHGWITDARAMENQRRNIEGEFGAAVRRPTLEANS